MSNRESKVAGRQARYDAIAQYKINIGCQNSDCPLTHAGIPFRTTFLHLDHLDQSTKVASVSSLCGNLAPWSVIWAEVAKCRVLCGYCHDQYTFEIQRKA